VAEADPILVELTLVVVRGKFPEKIPVAALDDPPLFFEDVEVEFELLNGESILECLTLRVPLEPIPPGPLKNWEEPALRELVVVYEEVR